VKDKYVAQRALVEEVEVWCCHQAGAQEDHFSYIRNLVQGSVLYLTQDTADMYDRGDRHA
jgi:hypothetical protein